MVTITWKSRVVRQRKARRLPDLERLKEEEIALQCEQAAAAAVNAEPREITDCQSPRRTVPDPPAGTAFGRKRTELVGVNPTPH
eukprot:COSAG05_NODE_2222_length_3374_cov_153.524275_5_plen_84_part_00